MSDVKWFYTENCDVERWPGGPFDTKEEAIAKGSQEYEVFYVAPGRLLRLADFVHGVGLADDIIEQLLCWADDQIPDGAEEFICRITKEMAQGLADKINPEIIEWIASEKQLNPDLYSICGSKAEPVIGEIPDLSP